MFRKLSILAFAAFMLSSCALWQQVTGSSGNPPAGTTCSTALCVAQELLTGAHDAHATTANLLDQLAVSGVLVGSNATKAKALLDQSETYLTTADTALAAGDAATVSQSVAEATALVAQIEALIQGAK